MLNQPITLIGWVRRRRQLMWSGPGTKEACTAQQPDRLEIVSPGLRDLDHLLIRKNWIRKRREVDIYQQMDLHLAITVR